MKTFTPLAVQGQQLVIFYAVDRGNSKGSVVVTNDVKSENIFLIAED